MKMSAVFYRLMVPFCICSAKMASTKSAQDIVVLCGYVRLQTVVVRPVLHLRESYLVKAGRRPFSIND